MKFFVPIFACLVGLVPTAYFGGSSAVGQSTLPGSAGVPTADSVGLSAATASFLRTAASANLFEIESSRLALTRSQSERVKDFANRMVADHTRAAIRLKQALTEAAATMPPEMLDDKHQQQLESLKAAGNAEFDKAYVEAQYKAHIESISLATDYAKNGDNPRLRELVAQVVPILQSHLDHASTMR